MATMSTMEFAEKANERAAVLQFYGLKEQPFGVTPDPRFLYLTSSHREALASLVYAIETKRGFSALVADPGMGKTSLLFYLLEKIKPSARTAFLFRPDGSTRDLLQSLLMDIGVEGIAQDVPQMHETLNSVLLEELRAGRKFVWVLDEAQDLANTVLESVRLLSNFETSAAKLMHIILSGQSSLSDKLAQPELIQLRQRVSTLVRLEPLSVAETSDYIRHRSRIAGCTNDNLFLRESRMLIGRASQGIPRNINNICFSCLSLGFVEGRNEIGLDVVRQALADFEFETKTPKAAIPVGATVAPSLTKDFFEAPMHLAPMNLVERPPQAQSSVLWWGAAFLAFVAMPFLLILLESTSGFDLLRGSRGEELVSRITGNNVHLPDPPDKNVRSLQPPKALNLPESEKRRANPTDGAANAPDNLSDSSPSSLVAEAKRDIEERAGRAPNTTKKIKGVSRVVYARGGESLYTLAYAYYGKSNMEILAQLRAHNPQLKGSDATLKQGQPIVIPDLSPEYPWKGSAAYASHPSTSH